MVNGTDPVTCLLGLIAGDSLGEQEVMRMFLEDRQENGDFISKVADMVLRRNGTGTDAVEATTYQENAANVSSANHVYAIPAKQNSCVGRYCYS
jgi:hypothetical protein